VMTSFDLEISVCQGIVSSFEPYFKVLVILWPCNGSYKLKKYIEGSLCIFFLV
jgi:hypothetical protein